jgi:small nuclear ribonucleoprotein (snRNP)-like protein
MTLREFITEAADEDGKYKEYKEKEGKEVEIVMKSGAKYAGKLSHVNKKRNFLVLDNLRIINKEGGETVSKRDTKRTFKIENIKSIRVL